jgi:chemotaxis protein MotB
MSRKKKHEHVNHERWLVSYADFITLLFAFFVVLFASSQSDKKKVQQVEKSIHSAFDTMGIFPAVSTVPNVASVAAGPAQGIGTANNDLDLSAKQLADLNRMKQRMEKLLAIPIAAHTVAISMGHDGLIISLREAGFFESGSADPIPASMNTLYAIARALAETTYDVRIEGNTDNIPIHNNHFDSNWELSTARATVLARIFIVNTHIAPVRISAAGYAEFHPVASNATNAGRSRNRRVDIIVLPNGSPISNIARSAADPNKPKPTRRVKSAATALHETAVIPSLSTTREFVPILKALRSTPPLK